MALLLSDEVDEVEVYDVLSAMAASLVENESHFMIPSVPDKEIMLKIGGKPPREIFYRKTATFMSSIPGIVSQKKCSCQFICRNALATIKCFSCATMDAYGTGYFCDLCFKSRHPWHRAPHIFADIEHDENIDHTIKVAHRRAEAVRYVKEGNELLERVRSQKMRVVKMGQVENVEISMQTVGRKTANLISRMRDLKLQLRKGILADENNSSSNDNNGGNSQSESTRIKKEKEEELLLIEREMAINLLKKVMKGFLIRKALSMLFVERTLRVWDPAAAKGDHPCIFITHDFTNVCC